MKIDPIKGLNMDYNYSKITQLSGPRPITSEYHLVIHSVLGKNFKNVLTISSPITLKNETSKSLEIKLISPYYNPYYSKSSDDNGKLVFDLDEDVTMPIPFDMVDCTMHIGLKGTK